MDARIKDKLGLMHQRMSHVSKKAIITMRNKNLVIGMPELPKSAEEQEDFCESCVLGKQARLARAKPQNPSVVAGI